MKKQFLLGILPVFAVSLLSFSKPVDTKITKNFCDYTSYCSGYADAKEEQEPMSMEEWTAVYDGCIAKRCPGY